MQQFAKRYALECRSCGLQDCSLDVQWQEEVAQKSDRPELSAAKIVISGMPHILSSG